MVYCLHLRRICSVFNCHFSVIPAMTRTPRVRYTKEELEFYKANFRTMSIHEMADKTGRTHRAVSQKCHELNLSNGKATTPWLPEHDAFLFKNTLHMTTAKMARKLNRTPHAVNLRIRFLGIDRDTSGQNPKRRTMEVRPDHPCDAPVYDTLPLKMNPFKCIFPATHN